MLVAYGLVLAGFVGHDALLWRERIHVGVAGGRDCADSRDSEDESETVSEREMK